MRLHTLIILMVLVILGLSIGMYSLLDSFYVYDTAVVPINVSVGNVIGFNLDRDALNMGTIPEGGSAERNFTITNDLGKTSRIKIVKLGEIKGWIFLSDNGFTLGPEEKKDILVEVRPPEDAERGKYKGYLEIRFLRE